MRVATKAYGPLEVDERQKITFPQGLFGFETIKDYVILDAERQPFYWLQSLDVEQVAFVIINPFLFRPDYELDIDDELLKDIGITSPEKALIFTIVTIPGSGPMTANLQGPIIINRDARLGKQGILTDHRWKTKHDILEELSAAKKSPAAPLSAEEA
ncbi:MAG: flagellar assembly protein FliW [Treponema sp.]|nr:flagellar assembly protein FliW [Treponema sp.]